MLYTVFEGYYRGFFNRLNPEQVKDGFIGVMDVDTARIFGKYLDRCGYQSKFYKDKSKEFWICVDVYHDDVFTLIPFEPEPTRKIMVSDFRKIAKPLGDGYAEIKKGCWGSCDENGRIKSVQKEWEEENESSIP